MRFPTCWTTHHLGVAALSLLFIAPTYAADTGRTIYATNCVVCHGQNGRPDANSPVVEGLGVLPADFSDPLFNSREPAGDWEMVIKYGGHALGLAEQMPAQQDALSDEQISEVTRYIKSMVDTSDYPPGEMNLMLPTRTKKAFPEDEVVYKGRYTNQPGTDTTKNVVEFEKRIGERGQAIVELVQNSRGSDSELSEIEIGYKRALSFSKDHILSGMAKWNSRGSCTTCTRLGHDASSRRSRSSVRTLIGPVTATWNGLLCHRCVSASPVVAMSR